MNRNRARGFSLLELCMSIVLILLVAYFILVYERRALSRPRDSCCASNLEQLAIAMQLYAADYGGRAPVASVPKAIFPYVENEMIFKCPANPVPQQAHVPYDKYNPYRRAAPEADQRPAVGYMFRKGFWTDDPPHIIIVADTAPDVHSSGTWQGAHLDGAVGRYPAAEWQPLD